jgi:hypothetical protein
MKSTITLAALAAFALAGSAHAATIAWSGSAFLTNGTSPWALLTGQFDTTGTQILAENSGGGAVPFDGINFTAPTIGFGNTFSGYHSGSPVTLASTGTWSNSAGTVNLTGLTSGYTYRIQALVIDGRASDGIQTITGRTVLFDGTNQSFTIQTRNPANTLNTGGQLNALTLYQTAIPEPSTALLGGLGLLALLLRRR